MLISIFLIIPLITAVACVLIKKHNVSKYISVTGSFALLLYNIYLGYTIYLNHSLTELNGFFYVDALSLLTAQIVSVVGFAAALYSIGYMDAELHAAEFPEKRLRWYYFLFHMFIFTMLAVCVANNLGIMWVAIEATTLSTTFLVGFYNKKPHQEAAWKYIIICTVGITLALFGVILTYHSSKNVVGEIGYALNWTDLLAVADRFEPHLMKLAFLFIIIGYGTKAGLAPMHTWLPDAHSQAPSPISALFSGVLLNCSLYGIIRFHVISSKCLGPNYSCTLLMAFGLTSVIVSIPFILVQRDYKRLFAFSSIEHIGFIALGLGFGGMYSIYGAELHTFNHAVAKSLLFFCGGNLFLKYKTREMESIKGIIRTMPVTGVILIIAVFAITGIPPFNIFVSEFIVLADAFSSGSAFVLIFTSLLIVFLVLIFVGYINNIFKMIFSEPAETVVQGEVSKFTIAAMCFLLVFVLIISFYVPPIMRVILSQISDIIRNA
ncbi:Hydrogenase-4 component B [Candidatus Brocadiaceae bacterium B188]|mgnify:FL=1|jgi:hydrogenase-4 component F|nr:hydrogenase 4 subunit F [Candidatus Brocadia sapporoensis]MEB2309354.1 hydrogenase 4 subunit F [Candidatus Brocadiaceae bacterium]OQZ04824.1 MAG: hydrogenase [Candidatus Brocadia sp. UTAMX1]RZV56628.1 MAG: hydrogenase 4 subunit F [Candidatus Brocadia sp. BROELEC01]TWU52060.1 Hydrogenase-4 component B [Candidatus Brocadiaceae bacterium B188]